MLQFLKRYKQLLVGIVIGGVVATAGVASADQSISAIIKSNIKFNINGEDVALPAEYKVLNYQGSTYVPVRFIAEALQSTTIDFADNTIYIDQESSGDDYICGVAPDGSVKCGPSNVLPGTADAPVGGTGTGTIPAPTPDPDEAGRTYGVYKEMKTRPVYEVSNKNIVIPATYKLESNAYATRVAGVIYNNGSAARDVIIRAEFYDANNKLIAKGLGYVNNLAVGTSRTFLAYADVKLTNVDYYTLTIE